MQSCKPPKGMGKPADLGGTQGKGLLHPLPSAPSLTINRLAGPAETMVCLFSAEGARIGGLADLSKRSD